MNTPAYHRARWEEHIAKLFDSAEKREKRSCMAILMAEMEPYQTKALTFAGRLLPTVGPIILRQPVERPTFSGVMDECFKVNFTEVEARCLAMDHTYDDAPCKRCGSDPYADTRCQDCGTWPYYGVTYRRVWVPLEQLVPTMLRLVTESLYGHKIAVAAAFLKAKGQLK